MTNTIELYVYNDQTQEWVAPLANGQDLQALAQIVHDADGKLEQVTEQLAQTEMQVSTLQIYPLGIKTFDGSNEPLHPSVLYFTNGWRGWKFWMAYTPMPIDRSPYTDRWECPSIAVSNNGINWVTPQGFKNPLDDLTPEQIARKDYFSDTALAYNPNNDTLEVWYRHTDGSNLVDTDTYRVITSDGVNWSAKEKVLEATNLNNGLSLDRTVPPFRSPSIVIKDGKYICIYNDNIGLRICEITNPSSGIWTNDRQCVMPSNYANPWHTGVIYQDGKYHMTAYYLDKKAIAYLISNDGLTWTFVKEIINANERKYSNLVDLYQTVPVKVGANWYVYATCKVKVRRNSSGTALKHGIFLLQGESIGEVVPSQQQTVEKSRHYFDASVFLNNDDKPNSDSNNIVLKTSEDESEVWGIGLSHSLLTGRPYLRFISDKSQTSIIPSIYYSYGKPSRFNYIGEMWVDGNDTRNIYLCTGANEWRRLKVDAPNRRVNTSPTKSVNVSDVELVVFNANTTDNLVEFLTGGSDGQQVILLNTTSQTITLKHSFSYDENSIHTKSAQDISLRNQGAITLLNVSGSWYEV